MKVTYGRDGSDNLAIVLVPETETEKQLLTEFKTTTVVATTVVSNQLVTQLTVTGTA